MGLAPLTGWVLPAYSVGMKTWILLAALLNPLNASAQWLPADPAARMGLLNEIEATRDALLPQTEPLPQVTVRFQPRLNQVKDAVVAAKTLAELDKAKKDFTDWKKVVISHLHGESPRGEALNAFEARKEAEARFVLALRQQLTAARAKERLDPFRSAGSSNGAWSGIFDNASPSKSSGISDGAVRADNPRAANDPVRYAKVRALLLSQGVSKQIVDLAIAEGIRSKVDPMIVLSVINQESNFRKTAYNKGSGCTGLMQLDVATAADMGVHASLYDPAANIKAGVKYLNWIANSFFKMNLDMSDLSRVPAEKLKIVLASYNWGVGNVRNFLKKHGEPALELVAPKETRDYITQIPNRISNWFASI